ncbi:MAG TPA: GNAT family N-acetyltransferase [Micromonosporaceae bacterium]|nr:GNAT family N-acetyltransferase [Micromonosporaceae bacterium]
MLHTRDDGWEVSDDPARLDLARIHAWLSTDAYWAIGRTPEVVARSVANSVNFGLYRGGELLGYCRFVTDCCTFAWLCDVYLDRSVRGAGVGTWFVGAALDEVRGWGPGRVILATADAHGLYAKLGFTPMVEPDRWMELRFPSTPPPRPRRLRP